MSTDDGYGHLELGQDGLSVADAASLFAGTRRRQTEAGAWVKSLEAAGYLQRQTLVEYRCAERGDLLARVVSSPVGSILILESFKLSPDENAGTSPDARETRTSDGENHWKRNIDVLPEGGMVPHLNCDHVRAYEIPVEEIHADASARPAEPILIPRRAVR